MACASCCGKAKQETKGCDDNCDKSVRFAEPANPIPEIVVTSPSDRSMASTPDRSMMDPGSILESTYQKNIANVKCLEPYLFRVIGPNSLFEPYTGRMDIKAPPFHVLIDHTLACVWCLFSKNTADRMRLGVGQLQWALYFLKGLRLNNGDYARDVKLVVNTMEDYLLENYADMAVAAMKTQTEREACRCDLKHASPKPLCDYCSNTKLVYTPRKTKSVPKTETSAESTPSKKSKEPSYDKASYFQKMFHSIPNETITSLSFASEPSELSSPVPVATSTPVDNRRNLRKEIEDLRAMAAALSSENLEEQGSDEAFSDMLTTWRQDQIDKIKTEIGKLHSIERLIADEEFQDMPEFTPASF